MVVCTYVRAYIHLRFKHAVLGTRQLGLSVVGNERQEGVVALHLPVGPFKTLSVGERDVALW